MSAETLQSAGGEFEPGDRTTAFKAAIARCFADINTKTGVSVLIIRGNDGAMFGYTDMTRKECFFQESFLGEDTERYQRRYETIGVNTARTEFAEDGVGAFIHISPPLQEFNFRPSPGSHSSRPLIEFMEVLDRIEMGGKDFIGRQKTASG
jgi:hypothetical protein